MWEGWGVPRPPQPPFPPPLVSSVFIERTLARQFRWTASIHRENTSKAISIDDEYIYRENTSNAILMDAEYICRENTSIAILMEMSSHNVALRNTQFVHTSVSTFVKKTLAKQF